MSFTRIPAKRLGLALISVLCVAITTQAQTTIFEFGTTGQASQDLDELFSGSTTSNSVVLTASLNDAAFTFEGTGFGIDGVTGGGATAGEFNPGEIMSISFNVDVLFNSFLMGAWDGSDLPSFAVPGQSPIIMDTAALHVFPTPILLSSGDIATFQSTGGNGFSLEHIEITAVPEPSSLALLALCTGSLLLLRRRRG